MILSDRSIRAEIEAGRIEIDPYDDELVQPSSVDVRLGAQFQIFENHSFDSVRPKQAMEGLTRLVDVNGEDTDGHFVIHPGEFILGTTHERLRLPDDLVARVEGKSSLGRLGLLIHATAGYVDPGWNGQLTLELSNVSRLPIHLHPGMRIGQLVFVQMTTPADRPYGSPGLGSKYQNQVGPVPSQYHMNDGG